MNKRYHASASQTLAAIQSLYEAKLLSYPRTDCAYITDEEFDYLVANLPKYLGLVSKKLSKNTERLTEPPRLKWFTMDRLR